MTRPTKTALTTAALMIALPLVAAAPASAIPTQCEPGYSSVSTTKTGDADVLVQAFQSQNVNSGANVTDTWSVTTSQTQEASLSASVGVSIDAVIASAQAEVSSSITKSLTSEVGVSRQVEVPPGETRSGGYYLFVNKFSGTVSQCDNRGQLTTTSFTGSAPAGQGFK